MSSRPAVEPSSRCVVVYAAGIPVEERNPHRGSGMNRAAQNWNPTVTLPDRPAA